MSIKDILEKCKSAIAVVGRQDIYTALIIILVAFISFGLGRLSGMAASRMPVAIEYVGAASVSAGSVRAADGVDTEKPVSAGGAFVASKTGEAYHFPWCSGVLRIKEENKVWFETREAAEAAGYRPAKNCKGL